MSTTPMGDLFFEIIQMMGMRGYNVLPFNFLINNKIMNNRYKECGELDKVREISDNELLQSLMSYREANFQLDRNLFGFEKMGFSMVFDHCSNGMRTLVLIANDIKGITSKDTLVDFITNFLKVVVSQKTGGKSSDPLLRDNKVSAIFVLPGGISPFSKTFVDKFTLIEIITEDDIKSRVYDSVLQSHYKTIPLEEKNMILSEVGLNSTNIPSISKDNDTACKILGLKKKDLLVATRTKISSEETLDRSVFFREIK